MATIRGREQGQKQDEFVAVATDPEAQTREVAVKAMRYIRVLDAF